MDDDDIWITSGEESTPFMVVFNLIFFSIMLFGAIVNIGDSESEGALAALIISPLFILGSLLSLFAEKNTAVNFIVNNIVEETKLFGSLSTTLISFREIAFFAYGYADGYKRLKIILRSGNTHVFSFGDLLSPRYQRLISAIDASNPNPYRSSVQLDDGSPAELKIAPIHFASDKIALDVKDQKIIVGKLKAGPLEIRFSDISNVIVLISVDSPLDSETKTFNRYCLCAILNTLEKIELTDYETDRQGDEARDKMWAARLHINAYLENAQSKQVG